MHICIYARMHILIYVCICTFASMHTCINAYLHTGTHAYMHICIHASMHESLKLRIEVEVPISRVKYFVVGVLQSGYKFDGLLLGLFFEAIKIFFNP